MIKDRENVYLAGIADKNFDFSVRAHLASLNYPTVYRGNWNLVSLEQEHVMVLDSTGHWPAARLPDISLLLLRNNFILLEHDLRELKNLRQVVSDGSNGRRAVVNAREVCRKFGIRFCSTAEIGSYYREFSEE